MKKHRADTETELQIVVKGAVCHFEHVPKWKLPHVFHTSSSFMDYLHGDVEQREAFLACHYEYARESKCFWKAAQKRDELLGQGKDILTAVEWACQDVSTEYGSIPANFSDFLVCPSFPKMDWQELSEDERKVIKRFLPDDKIQPLTTPYVRYLKTAFIFEKFVKMEEDAKPDFVKLPGGQTTNLRKLVLPILQQHEKQPRFFTVFLLDFSKGETQLLNEFRAWLRLPDNHARLEEFKKPKVGTTGKWLDRLKDLAAWRLFRELDNDLNAANRFANAHRKTLRTPREIAKKYKNKTPKERDEIKAGSGKPFRDAKRQRGIAPSQAELFGEEADPYRAITKANEYLTEILPMDFPSPPGPEMQAAMKRITKLASKK